MQLNARGSDLTEGAALCSSAHHNDPNQEFRLDRTERARSPKRLPAMRMAGLEHRPQFGSRVYPDPPPACPRSRVPEAPDQCFKNMHSQHQFSLHSFGCQSLLLSSLKRRSTEQAVTLCKGIRRNVATAARGGISVCGPHSLLKTHKLL